MQQLAEHAQQQECEKGRQLSEMMCYNEKRDFMCWIPRKQDDSEKLADIISQRALAGGLKAYFKAYVDKATKQLIVVPNMLPAQPW